VDSTPTNKSFKRFTLKEQTGILLYLKYFGIKLNRKFLLLCSSFSSLWWSPLQKGARKYQQISVKCTTEFFDAGSPDANIPEEVNEPLRIYF